MTMHDDLDEAENNALCGGRKVTAAEAAAQARDTLRAVHIYVARAIGEGRAVGANEIAEALSPTYPWLDTAFVREILQGLYE